MKSKKMEFLYMDNIKAIKKIIKCIDKIIDFTNDIEYEKFISNNMIQDACFMNLMQIGENATKIDDDYIRNNNEIKWKEIKGLRNRIVHDYDGVNINIVWDTIKKDLPNLREQLMKLISNI